MKRARLRFVPLWDDCAHYRMRYLGADLMAGLNVTLIAFPQAIIYALMAGLPIEYGLYGMVLASIAGALFSGSNVLSIGPTNASAIVILSAFSAAGIPSDQFGYYLPIILVLTGVFLIISAFLNIASLMQYVSQSVICGYTCALTLMMIVFQIHNAFGFDLIGVNPNKATFFDITGATLMNLRHASLSATGICCLTFFFFFLWKRIAPNKFTVALTLLSLGLVNFCLVRFCSFPLASNDLHVHAWSPSVQGFNMENLHTMVGVALTLSFVSLIDGNTILKTLSSCRGKRSQVNQMAWGMGWANIFCGLGSGMPAACSNIRSASNYLSGAKTALTSLFCALFFLLSIALFAPCFSYIPKCGLSMVIVLLGLELLDKHKLQVIFKTSLSDTCVFCVTCLSAFVVPLNVAIFIGVLISIALFLRKAAVPAFREYVYEGGTLMPSSSDTDTTQSEVSIIHINGHLFFGSSDLFNDQIREICKRPQLKAIILKFRRVLYIDATCLLALESLARFMHLHNRQLILTEVSTRVLKIIQRSGLSKDLPYVFLDDNRRSDQPTLDALMCAQSFIGDGTMVVRIMTNASDHEPLKGSIQSLKPLKDSNVTS